MATVSTAVVEPSDFVTVVRKVLVDTGFVANVVLPGAFVVWLVVVAFVDVVVGFDEDVGLFSVEVVEGVVGVLVSAGVDLLVGGVVTLLVGGGVDDAFVGVEEA